MGWIFISVFRSLPLIEYLESGNVGDLNVGLIYGPSSIYLRSRNQPAKLFVLYECRIDIEGKKSNSPGSRGDILDCFNGGGIVILVVSLLYF